MFHISIFLNTCVVFLQLDLTDLVFVSKSLFSNTRMYIFSKLYIQGVYVIFGQTEGAVQNMKNVDNYEHYPQMPPLQPTWCWRFWIVTENQQFWLQFRFFSGVEGKWMAYSNEKTVSSSKFFKQFSELWLKDFFL